MNNLPPDREMLSRFAEIMFKHASLKGYVSLRAFPDTGSRGQKALFVDPIPLGDKDFVDTLVERARQTAEWHEPAVFCPPVATFRDHKNAKTDNICEGVALSVECDQYPREARQTLEAILGEPTVVVQSGGIWTNPNTCEVEPKVHLHWRLSKPTSTKTGHDTLREARGLATKLVDGDDTNISIVHPIRWPGSLHRKNKSVLARIVSSSDRDIDLAAAVERLRVAAGGDATGAKTCNKFRADDPEAVKSALSVIPNNNLEWNDWNLIGMGTWGATKGSEVGREAFAKWSAKSSKNDPNATESRWQHYKTSPPTRIGFGTLVYLARKHSPGWSYGSAEAKFGEASATAEEQADPGGLQLDDFYAYMPSHSYIFIPSREMWPASSVNSRLSHVPLLHKDGTQAKDKDGNPKFIRPSNWLDTHRPVEMMTWALGMPVTIVDRLISKGGWVERKGVTTFNLYRPPSITLGDASKATPWIDLVRKVYPNDAEEIFNFFAHRRQKPEQKINHALLLGGDPGIGKDTMIEPLKQAVGPWNCKEVSPQDMMSNYNEFMQSVVLRISEARDLGDINRYSFYDHLKTVLATPPDVTRVNAKYVPQHYVLNVCGVITTTNYKTNGIYLPADDRRTYVAWSDIKQTDFEAGFWLNFWSWYTNENGFSHVAAFLAERDISGFDAKAPPKKTAAFWAIVDANAAPEEGELADVIDKMSFDVYGRKVPVDATTLIIVARHAEGRFQEWLLDRKNRRAIPHRFERCGYVPVRNNVNEGLWIINGKRQVIYARSELSLADQIRAAKRLANE